MESTPLAPSNRVPSWGWALLIACVVVVVFSRASAGALLMWDDDINIVMNAHLRGLNGENLRWMFTDFDYMRRYVPLTWLNWAVDYELFGLTARSTHVGNIALHALNAVLVFLLLRRVLAAWRGRALAADPVVAAFAALLWAVHPLRVEVVAWASGRIYLQTTCFLLLATLAYFRAAEVEPQARHGWLGLAVAGLAASLLTYPLGISYVLLLFVIDAWVLRRFVVGASFWRDPRNRAVLVEKLPFVGITIAVVAVTLAARWHAAGLWNPPPSLAEFGVGARVAQAAYIWVYYVWRALAPFGLAPVYTTLVSFEPTAWPFVGAIGFVVGLSGWLILKRRAWPAALALWLAHLAVLIPVLGLTEHPHYPADRYGYVQGVVWIIAAAAGLAAAWNRGARVLTATVTLLAIVGLSFLTVAQIRIWRDSETLFRFLETKLEGQPYQGDIAMRLGEVLRKQGRLAEASFYLEESLRLLRDRTNVPASHYALGLIAETLGRREEAARHYEAALRADPQFEAAGAALRRVRTR